MFPSISCLLCLATAAQLVPAAEASAQSTCPEDVAEGVTKKRGYSAGASLLQTGSHVEWKTHGKGRPTMDAGLYLDTVRDTLTGAILRTASVPPMEGEAEALPRRPYHEETRWSGNDWCEFCYTMAGGARVQNVRDVVSSTIIEDVPGDFLEAGTWRGGCSIMARVVQHVLGEAESRRTYLCDSFSGLPPSSQEKDSNRWNGMHFLEVSQSEVEDNVRRFVPLDDNLRFVKGYFAESLPRVRAELQRDGRQLAVLRGDGDMYESYLDILFNLYEFVPVGGYFICDDAPSIQEAQQAIDDFRSLHGIAEPIQRVAGSVAGVFWRKENPTPVNYTHYLEWNETRHFNSLLARTTEKNSSARENEA